MTLTGALEDDERKAALAILRAAYRPIDELVVDDAVSLLRQDAPDMRFAVIARWPLQAPPQ